MTGVVNTWDWLDGVDLTLVVAAAISGASALLQWLALCIRQSKDTVHNERVKLMATALNQLGVGAIIAGLVAPMVRGEINALASVLVWVGVGVSLFLLAQLLLGRLR